MNNWKGMVWDFAGACLLLCIIWWTSQVLLGLELVTPEQAWSGVAASLFGLGLGVSGLKIKRDWKIGGAACLAMAIILTGFIY